MIATTARLRIGIPRLPAAALARGARARVRVRMRARMHRWLLCIAALVGGASAHADPGAAASAPAQADSAHELQAWLTRIHEAAVHSNYVGTLVNTAGGTVVSSRVTHYCEGRTVLERVDALDGEMRGMLRINDETRTLWPRYRISVVEPVDPRASFPSLVSGSEQHIPEYYELHREAGDRVAGHDADRLLLKARDSVRFDHVIWADRATGLMLRADVQSEGRTLETSAFSEVKIGVRPQPDAIYAELHRADGYRVLRPAMQPTRLEDEGWSLRASLVPPGFQSLGCVRRSLPMPGPDASELKVLQTIFSDGLTHVSLFIEPYQPQRHKTAGLTVIGATHTLTRRVDDTWLTAVGDVPDETLEKFIGALQRRP